MGKVNNDATTGEKSKAKYGRCSIEKKADLEKTNKLIINDGKEITPNTRTARSLVRSITGY
jgi:hypothetical protein